jgi:hypothetical protein
MVALAGKNLRSQLHGLSIVVSSPRFKAAARANATTPQTFAANVLMAAAEGVERCRVKRRPLKRVFIDFE